MRSGACGLWSFVLMAVAAVAGCASSDSESNSGGQAGGAGSAGGEARRIIIVTNGPDPFWDTCEAGAKAAEKELGLVEKGFVVDFQRGDFTDKRQIEMLKQYVIASDVAAVGVSVFNPESRNLATEMRTLQGKGVKVVTIDSDLNREKYRDARFAYLGTDNIIGGRELGRAARAIAPDGAKFAFFVGDLGVANAVERMSGFIEGVDDDSKYVELARLSDGGDRTKARKNVEDLLNQHSECEMLVGIWAYNTPQIVNVVDDRMIREKTKIICFDAAQDAINGMGQGKVDVMVVQNPYQMGFDGVKLMHALATDDQTTVDGMYPDYAQEGERDLYRTELRVVAPDEGSPLTSDLFDESTIFFNYSEFQQWLKDRGLVSS
ncbi:MAG: substrate-binding domain-containing protein [Planctomycetales bacterium]|nr:substrate-binding domain-containing protein [Planctomycetales bacterium]